MSVSVYAASIYSKNDDIVKNLFSVSSDAYNIEVERFITFVQHHPPVIIGMGMFKVTKSMVLQIATTLIMYELVLAQYKDL
ncbi:gustatory receptor for sugar taste 64b-like [Sitophilus oryzae]|uniref:Gustatory receptor for sugar taste 64b-like n=1 Tax=Sitophilus oryzae TaxID=7048 RepID=A0A6J2YDK7_SITOR|nr:gustatory receptor for sugar taste 64b-like [Sitophilus oryzae]